MKKDQTPPKDQFAEREAQKYEHPIPSREFILEYLSGRDRPASFRQISTDLNLDSPIEKEALRRRLLAMARQGQLLQNRRGAFGLLAKMDLIAGRIFGHKDGYGFVIPDAGGDDLFLNARQMRNVFHGDKVLVQVAAIDHRGRREGSIVEVIEHNTKELVGRLMLESGIAFVHPTNSRIARDILIPPENTLGATQGQMVIIEIVTQPSAASRPIGLVKEILGNHMAPGMEIDVAIRNHDLPIEWPEAALKEAAKFAAIVPESESGQRLDLRHIPFVTIDGEDAKDFDDAVYCQPNPKGGWTLYVAIADVSHYVKANSALDQEALNRGNSVYFPGRVIPMLPEELSNELCSLKPKVDRLTLVCEMNITPKGKISRYHFHEAVICSAARLTYQKVYDMVEKNDLSLQQEYSSLFPHIQNLFGLYRVLHALRTARGAIDFDLPETRIIFGEDRKIERIVPLQRNDAHKLIEEFMLCANICAALFLLKNECPALYRTHQGPTAAKLMDLRKFLGEMGLSLTGKDEPSPKDYAVFLKSIAARADAHLIQTVLLRSLSQAIYSSDNNGHFGLAFEAYTHFTSPIRRYPDLLVHRAIRSVLQRKFTAGSADAAYSQLGEHCSMTERRADEATREAVDWLKCEYMLDKVGEDFAGVISSVNSFGFFVELAEIYVEGLVHISSLPNDYYHFEPLKHEIYGERSHKRYRLGQVVKIKVVRVDLDQRKMDFVLELDPTEQQFKLPKKKKAKKKK
jgi:ribonuclease R